MTTQSSGGSKCDPPDVHTDGAEYKDGSSKLYGMVNPHGNASSAYFEYSFDNSHWSVTAAQSLTGSVSQSVSSGISGLTPNTKYYYRVIATSARGAGTGATNSFTTPAVAPTATTGGASSLTRTAAAIAGSGNPNGAASDAWVEYGKTTSLGSKSGSQALGSGVATKSLAFTLGTLTANTKYYYRVVVRNAVGTTTGATLTVNTTR
jgi:phosphodiesterase/alkaline phosphatase D-like protein